MPEIRCPATAILPSPISILPKDQPKFFKFQFSYFKFKFKKLSGLLTGW